MAGWALTQGRAVNALEGQVFSGEQSFFLHLSEYNPQL